MGEHGPDDLEQGYHLDDLTVRPAACEIVREGRTVRLEPQVMALLQLLSSRPGEVFSRTEIEAQVWPDVVVGYDSLTKCVAKLREALGDTHRPPRLIQTIPKRGYRLVASVSPGLKPRDGATSDPAPRRLRAGIAGLLVVALLVAGVLWATLRSPPPDAAPPVVMVLPREPLARVKLRKPRSIAFSAMARSAFSLGTGRELASGAWPVFTEMKPPAWMTLSREPRSTARSLRTGKARARKGSITMVSPS